MEVLNPSDIKDVEVDENSGYFFKRLGEVAFSAPDNDGTEGLAAPRIAVASRSGILFAIDPKGEVLWGLFAIVHGEEHLHIVILLLLNLMQGYMWQDLRNCCSTCRSGTAVTSK